MQQVIRVQRVDTGRHGIRVEQSQPDQVAERLVDAAGPEGTELRAQPCHLVRVELCQSPGDHLTVTFVQDRHQVLGMGAELAAQIQHDCFYSLEAPVERVGGYNIPYPPSRFEEEFLPGLDRVLDAVDRTLAH